MSFEPLVSPRVKAMATQIPVAAEVNCRNWMADIWLKYERAYSPL